MDAHRSTAFVVGPYVRRKFVDSTRYNTIDMIRTMEEVLGTAQLNLNDASALPMATLFDLEQKAWDYKATASAVLKSTGLPIAPGDFEQAAAAAEMRPLQGPAWWDAHTQGMDFSVEDRLDSTRFNSVLWRGTMGDRPYPTDRDKQDLRRNREELLKRSQAGGEMGKQGENSSATGASASR